MALIYYNFHSYCLRGDAGLNMILPDCPDSVVASDYYREHRKYKVVWLLHGGKGDCSDWLRKSRIESYANKYQLAVVLPSAYNTMYMDWLTYANGYCWNSFFLTELIPLVHGWFPISAKREDNFLAGLGGGGVATFKYSVTHPEYFVATAALSTSPRDYDQLFSDGLEKHPKFVRVVRNWGSLENFLNSDDNVKKKMEEYREKGKLSDFPSMLAITGEKDHEINQFRDFIAFSETFDLPIEYRIVPGKSHDWEFWDWAIQEAFAFFVMKSAYEGREEKNGT